MTALQLRTVEMLDAKHNSDETNKMCTELLASPIFENEHILCGVSPDHLAVLERKARRLVQALNASCLRFCLASFTPNSG